MNWNKLAIAATAGAALLGVSPAFANPPHWAPAHGWHARHHHHPRPVVIYAPAPVYYAPPQVYYAPPPPPVFVPGPVFYGRIPVAPGLRVSFGVRL